MESYKAQTTRHSLTQLSLTILPSWVTNVSVCVCVDFTETHTLLFPCLKCFSTEFVRDHTLFWACSEQQGQAVALIYLCRKQKTFSLFFLVEWLYFLPLMHACFSQREELELRFPRTPHRREVWKWPKRLSALNKHLHFYV